MSGNQKDGKTTMTVGRWIRWSTFTSVLAASVVVGYADDKNKAALAVEAARNHSTVGNILIGGWILLFVICFVVLLAVGIFTSPFGRNKDKGGSSSAGGWSTVRR